ncbi:MAG: glycosyltransferase family 4 protein [Anaerolineales bacterium]|nr:glycosyltransferase family 4 protein [Anaerolineales bacterium]
MNIAIDASRTTRRQRTGTENYALQLLRHLAALENLHHYTLYFRDEPPRDLFPSHPNWTQRVIPWRRMWTHLRFAEELWRTRPDVTFVPAHTLPRHFPGKAVVTIHDLGYLHFPDAHPLKERRYLDWSTAFSARRATLVLADSQATQADLVKHYQIPAEKIRVVYPGVDDSLRPVTDPQQLAHVRAKYGLNERYLFFLGTLQPRKNIERLVKAYARWWLRSNTTDVQLVLSGNAGWLYQEAWTANIEGVHLTGYVADEDVAALYSGAIALVFPSLYEGFGFPVLEAMRCGTPVICSNTSSLPELVGDAALLVDPTSTDDIATAIGRLVKDDALRQDLITKGYQQAAQFTWQRTAEQTLAVLEEALALS